MYRERVEDVVHPERDAAVGRPVHRCLEELGDGGEGLLAGFLFTVHG